MRDPDAARATRTVAAPPTVLVCDDERAMRALMRATLELDDYDIVEAGDGDEAIRLARQFTPDVVLLDVMMPGRTGIEVLEELRADADLAAVPVVVVTASIQREDRERATAAGATAVVAKPFSPRELRAIVRELVRDRSDGAT